MAEILRDFLIEVINYTLLEIFKWERFSSHANHKAFSKAWGEKNEFPNMLHTEIEVIYSHQFQNEILETTLILLPSHEFITLASTVLDIQYLN